MSTLDELLERARMARSHGDGAGCLRALEEAQVRAQGTDRAVMVAWRRAKAEHDFGTAHGVLASVTPLIGAEDPFAGSDAALTAVDVLVRAIRDEAGYLSPVPDRLLELASRAWLARGDIIRSLWVEVQLAWALACRGDLEALEAMVARAERIRPRDVGGSSSRHARAADPQSSLAWMQLDLARTWLRGATWCRDLSHLPGAIDALEDALEATGLNHRADPWVLEAWHAGLRLRGSSLSQGDLQAWEHALRTVESARQRLHRQLRFALIGRDGFLPAAATAKDLAVGPEWHAWALQEALAQGEDAPASELVSLIAQRGLSAFRAPA